MDDFVCKILNDWGLSEWIETFREQGVDKKYLLCLEDQDVEELISKVGPRAHFRKKLRLLKEEQNRNEDTLPLSLPVEQEQKNTTVQAEVQPSTSDGGKRKLDLEEFNRREPTPKRFRRMSASLPELRIQSEVKKVMKQVLDKLHNNENTKLNSFLRDKIKDLETDRRELVGVFGKTGAGKTSLINALIDERKLLPSGDVDACTSVMIKVEANMCNKKYEAHIEFITKEEWKDELWSVSQFQENTEDQKKEDEDDDYQDLAEKLSALYGEEWKQKSSKQLMDPKYFKKIPQFLQSTVKILSCETAKELSARLIKYTRTETNHGGEEGMKRWYWPLVKCVTVKVPHDFPQHITLVDLPGNGDRNKSRDTMWKGIVGNCSAVWIVTEINRAASEKESWEILNNVSSRIGNGGECRYIHFICTKSDDIEDSTDHSADLQAEIIRRNIKVKEAVRKEFNKLHKIKKHFSDDSFKVYTVSSKEFLKPKVLDPENTEIPELQDFLQNLNDSHSETVNYVSGAHGILSLIHGASLKKHPGKHTEVCEKLERNIALQLDRVQKAMERTFQVFEKCLCEGVERSKSLCENKLNNVLRPRGKSGSSYHSTLKSVFKNGGVHKPQKGKQINLNMKLTSFLTDSIDEEFRKTFPNERKCGSFNGVIDKFSLDTESLKEEYKDVELQLIFLKTEEEKLKKKLNKRIRYQKKIMYNSLIKTIEETMQKCYKTAAGYSGPGMLKKMKKTVSRHVHESKDTMFAKAKSVMLNHLLSLRVEILKTMNHTLNNSMDLSLRTYAPSIPDVSTELEMVKKIYSKLNNWSN
ncbi:nuclear GTPase SLIP-GC-like [Gambusia affinis]|uniref:nuclear GTPase SLIP-GC-like n=1 Tax=Gambusia affinis TaxID=33528 RepID=UPI001CDBFB6D|nr:nuclear GTPase SLIP-GC-like [Gambusia affinis]XP_043956344.1 nuclear GTPase SLIP-GC-like [Gambusia affinis]